MGSLEEPAESGRGEKRKSQQNSAKQNHDDQNDVNHVAVVRGRGTINGQGGQGEVMARKKRTMRQDSPKTA